MGNGGQRMTKEDKALLTAVITQLVVLRALGVGKSEKLTALADNLDVVSARLRTEAAKQDSPVGGATNG